MKYVLVFKFNVGLLEQNIILDLLNKSICYFLRKTQYETINDIFLKLKVPRVGEQKN